MRRLLLVITLAAALSTTAVALAVPSGTWKGKATSSDTRTHFGAVSFKVKGSKITDIKIEAVTVSGCGGFMSLYIDKATIKGSHFQGAYKPLPGSDQIVSINGTFKGGTAKGVFSAGPVCSGGGIFTAKRS